MSEDVLLTFRSAKLVQEQKQNRRAGCSIARLNTTASSNFFALVGNTKNAYRRGTLTMKATHVSARTLLTPSS